MLESVVIGAERAKNFNMISQQVNLFLISCVRVVLSHRKDRFFRIKERNALRIEDHIRTGKVRVLFNSHPEEIREGGVTLKCGEQTLEIENDYVWIFAGGVSPNSFLEKIGIQLGTREVKADPAANS